VKEVKGAEALGAVSRSRVPGALGGGAGRGYTAFHPDLKGCVAVGETREEALANLEEARRLWLETAYEHGDEIPFPPSWPFGRRG
jgi:predicted RNase H-like HicB family nuclease